MRNLTVVFILLLVVGAFSLFVGAAPEATPQTSERVAPSAQAEITLSFAPVVKRAAPAVVNVYTRAEPDRRAGPIGPELLFERFFSGRLGGPAPRPEQSLGSGVIVSPEGLVVTNQHVVERAAEITVVLSDRREYRARILLADEGADIAVLALDDVAESLPTLAFGDSDALEVGDLVLAIGNPFGVGQTVTSGIISARARSGGSGKTFLQTDAAINPGNSGGALVDMAGRLVGVNSAILTRSGGSNGVGFAIPASLVAQAVAQAERGADRLSRPWLGVDAQPVDAAIARTLGLDRPQGVMLTRVAPESPFAQAGLAPGAVVLRVDGAPIVDMAGLAFRVSALGVGAQASIEALVDGRRRTVDVALVAAPETPLRDVTQLRGRMDFAGLTIANLNPALLEEIAQEIGADLADALPRRGVIVLGVDGRARRSGVRPGDVIRAYNDVAVSQVSDIARLAATSPRARSVAINRRGAERLIRYGR